MGSILYWSATPEHGTCPGRWLIYPVKLHRRKLIFPLPSRYQLQKASWLEVGLCANLPFSVLGFCLLWASVGLMNLQRARLSWSEGTTLPTEEERSSVKAVQEVATVAHCNLQTSSWDCQYLCKEDSCTQTWKLRKASGKTKEGRSSC